MIYERYIKPQYQKIRPPAHRKIPEDIEDLIKVWMKSADRRAYRRRFKKR